MPYSYDNLISLPTREKLTHFIRNEKIFHLIFAEQFSRELLDRLCRLATTLRGIAKSKEGLKFLNNLLSHKSCMLFFTQPSTRTYLSFVRACQFLGINYAEVRDINTSSIFKGETDTDSVRTFSSYFDIIIMRHHKSGFAEKTAFMMNSINRSIPIVSGGAGQDEHPTQALLDIYTLSRSFEWRPDFFNNIHMAFMGDVSRGRTVQSLVKLLCLYDNIKISFVSPKQLTIPKKLKNFLDRTRTTYQELNDIKEIIGDIDAVYVTRIQDEYDTNESSKIDYTPFHLTVNLVKKMKKRSIVMHPLPRREELDPQIDFDSRAMYWRQERNGMWIRAALISYLFNAESSILDYYTQNYSY